MTYIALDDCSFRRERNIRAASGALLGIVLSAALLFAAWAHYEPPQRVVDRRMETACKWPQREGEWLAVLIHEGRVLCWRYR